MGYSSKASLLAAVDSMGELNGLTNLEDKLISWRFTESCKKTGKLRNTQQERSWIKSVRQDLRRVK
jgi:hypothetical protein